MPPSRTKRPGQALPRRFRQPAIRVAPRPRRKGTAHEKRDWFQIGAIAVAALPGLAAVIALLFTYQSIKATDAQLQIAEQGQITDRYNAAITNLGSSSTEVRLGGIYALQRLMQDSPRDQSTIVAVLCAFIRDESASAARAEGFGPHSNHQARGQTEPQQSPRPAAIPTDIQAAFTVVAIRNTANDGRTTTVDLDGAQLAFSQIDLGNLAHADLSRANLVGARLDRANLHGANLTGANLTGANLTGANLTGAGLFTANLTGAGLFTANLTDANLGGANLAHADLGGANLTDAYLYQANLHGADHIGANFRGADFTGFKADQLIPGAKPIP